MSSEISMNKFLIVGAGPAGLVCGIELLRQGYQVRIIERQKQLKRNVCGEYLSPQGVDYLNRLQLNDSIQDFRKIWGMQLISPGGRSIQTRFPQRRFGLAINRLEFQTRLLAIYQKLGGEITLGESIEKITANENGYQVKTENALPFFADAIIGADGRQSAVAKLLHMESHPGFSHRIAIHAFLKPHKELAPYGQMHILPDGSYVGINPISDAETNFSIVTDGEIVKKHGHAKSLINYWIAHSKYLGNQFQLLESEEVRTAAPISRDCTNAAKYRAALIGDASGFIDPLTGEGLTTAIKTAVLLVDHIKREANLESAFAAYAQARAKEYLEKENLNRILQVLIHYPTACELVAIILGLSERLRNTFIGVIGNIYSPLQAAKIFCKSLLRREKE